jgi:hypothetical protein
MPRRSGTARASVRPCGKRISLRSIGTHTYHVPIHMPHRKLGTPASAIPPPTGAAGRAAGAAATGGATAAPPLSPEQVLAASKLPDGEAICRVRLMYTRIIYSMHRIELVESGPAISLKSHYLPPKKGPRPGRLPARAALPRRHFLDGARDPQNHACC